MTFSILILGSSSALPTSKKYPSACVLNIHERFFLVDCGEGTQMQLRKYRIKLGKINHIFLSHLHGDHVFGLFGLIASFNLLGRKTDLHIYANKEIEKILESHFRFFDNQRDFKIIYHYLNPCVVETVYEDKNITVSSFPLKHRVPTNGFLFKEKKRPNHIIKEKIDFYNIPVKELKNIIYGADFIKEDGAVINNSQLTYPSYQPRSFSYCTDTAFYEKIIPVVSNTDLLLHESTFAQDKKEQAEKTYHSTASDASEIALKAGVKMLLLTHFSSRYKNTGIFLKEAKEKFNNTYIAEDGMEINIDKEHEFFVNYK